MKKLLSLLVIISILISSLCVSYFAIETNDNNNPSISDKVLQIVTLVHRMNQLQNLQVKVQQVLQNQLQQNQQTLKLHQLI